VFFSVDRFPSFVQPIAWVLPMTHLIQLVRPLTAGQSLELTPLVLHLGYLVVLAVVAFVLAYRRLKGRMFD
jgi:lipooligosaccharide transport system permease protein